MMEPGRGIFEKSASAITHRRGQSNERVDIALLRRLLGLLKSDVQVGDVRVVVLRVVNRHDLLGDVGLESVVSVRESGQLRGRAHGASQPGRDGADGAREHLLVRRRCNWGSVPSLATKKKRSEEGEKTRTDSINDES